MSTEFDKSFMNGDVVEADHIQQIFKPVEDLESGAALYRAATSTGATYEVSFRKSDNPDGNFLSSLSAGQMIVFKADANSGANAELEVTFEGGGTAAHPLSLAGDPVGADDIKADQIVVAIYNDTSTPRFDVVGLGGGAGGSIDQFDDVDVSTSTPQDLDVLQYDGANSEFVNRSLSAAGIAADADLTALEADVTTNTGDIATNASNITANASAIAGKQDILTGVNDVPGINVTSPQDGEILQYDSSTSEFKNVSSSSVGASELDELSDVSVSSPDTDHFLKHDGTEFTNVSAAAARTAMDAPSNSDLNNGLAAKQDNLTGVNDVPGFGVTAPQDGHVLQYDNGNSQFENRDLASAGIASSSDLTSGLAGKQDTLTGSGDVPGLTAELAAKQDNLTGSGDVPGLTAELAAKQDTLTGSGDVPGLTAELAAKQDVLTVVSDVPGIDVNAPADGQILQYDSISGDFQNQSRAINTAAPLSGGGDLSQDRTISMPAADGSGQDGYLTSAKFAEFDGKQDALTGSGDVPGLTAELAAKQDTLTDVNDVPGISVTTPQDGQVLQYDNGNSRFENRDLASAGIASSSDLTSGLAGKQDTLTDFTDVPNLAGELADKADLVHTHVASEITDFDQAVASSLAASEWAHFPLLDSDLVASNLADTDIGFGVRNAGDQLDRNASGRVVINEGLYVVSFAAACEINSGGPLEVGVFDYSGASPAEIPGSIRARYGDLSVHGTVVGDAVIAVPSGQSMELGLRTGSTAVDGKIVAGDGFFKIAKLNGGVAANGQTNALNDLSDVQTNSPMPGDLLGYDGTKFTNQSAGSFGFVTDSRQVQTSSPLSGGGTLDQDLTISIPAADGLGQDGYLSSAKFAEFDGKQDALTGVNDVPGMNVTSPQDGEILQYDSATSEFKNVAGSGVPAGGSDGQILTSQSGIPVWEDPSDSGVPIGSVMSYAGSSAPSGWLLMYGQAISRTTYADLFSVLGTVYGSGDGSTTFNLPDLRGRVVAGKDNMGGSSSNRLTSPINGDGLGNSGGSQSHTLSISEMPSHNHSVNDPGHRHQDYWDQSVQSYNPGNPTRPYSDYRGGISNYRYNYTSYSTTGIGINYAGSGQSHNNMQPTLVLNYIIFAGV